MKRNEMKFASTIDKLGNEKYRQKKNEMRLIVSEGKKKNSCLSTYIKNCSSSCV